MSSSGSASERGGLLYLIMSTASHSPEACSEMIPMRTPGDGGSICVVDDDPSMLRAVERLLKSDDFQVEKFSDLAAFLEALKQAPCRVAIIDIWMPDMNGLDLQTVLRKASPKTHIIFMSGRDDPSVRQAALDAGAFGFLSKPFDDEVLLQLVRKAISA